MKHFVAALCVVLFVLPAHAEDASPAGVENSPPQQTARPQVREEPELLPSTEPLPAPRPPAHQGYEFNAPRLLTQQLLWGLVHGVRLLANACRSEPEGAEVASLYADWQERYQQRIGSAARELALHYYGHEAATLGGLTAALKLRPALELPPEILAAACASFGEAIAAKRYDLNLYFSLRRDAARLARADAIHERVKRCHATLAPELQEVLTTALAGWEDTNGALETVVRARISAAVSNDAEAQNWQREAGTGAAPAQVACDKLAARLADPSHALRTAFTDDE